MRDQDYLTKQSVNEYIKMAALFVIHYRKGKNATK